MAEYQGSKPRGGRRRRGSQDGDPDSVQMEPNNDIPYIEAHEDLGELTLDQLDTFVVPARDVKGGFISIQLNVPPYMHRMIEIILKANRFPYLNIAAFVRHAIYRHIRYCTEIRLSIPRDIFHQLDTTLADCRDQEFKVKVMQVKQEIQKQIDDSLTRGEVSDAVRLLNTIRQQVDEIPESKKQKELRDFILTTFDYVLSPDGRLRKN